MSISPLESAFDRLNIADRPTSGWQGVELQNQSMTAKPKRRFFRFSLRAMLLVLTVFGVWLGMQVNRANNQRAVVRWLVEIDAEVIYDWLEIDEKVGSLRTEPPGPSWLRQQIGDEYFQSVVYVRAFKADVHDLSPLAKLPELEELLLDETPVTDLSPLAGLTKLEWLDLTHTQVSDLSPLANLSNLKILCLDGSQLTICRR